MPPLLHRRRKKKSEEEIHSPPVTDVFVENDTAPEVNERPRCVSPELNVDAFKISVVPNENVPPAFDEAQFGSFDFDGESSFFPPQQNDCKQEKLPSSPSEPVQQKQREDDCKQEKPKKAVSSVDEQSSAPEPLADAAGAPPTDVIEAGQSQIHLCPNCNASVAERASSVPCDTHEEEEEQQLPSVPESTKTKVTDALESPDSNKGRKRMTPKLDQPSTTSNEEDDDESAVSDPDLTVGPSMSEDDESAASDPDLTIQPSKSGDTNVSFASSASSGLWQDVIKEKEEESDGTSSNDKRGKYSSVLSPVLSTDTDETGTKRVVSETEESCSSSGESTDGSETDRASESESSVSTDEESEDDEDEFAKQLISDYEAHMARLAAERKRKKKKKEKRERIRADEKTDGDDDLRESAPVVTNDEESKNEEGHRITRSLLRKRSSRKEFLKDDEEEPKSSSRKRSERRMMREKERSTRSLPRKLSSRKVTRTMRSMSPKRRSGYETRSLISSASSSVASSVQSSSVASSTVCSDDKSRRSTKSLFLARKRSRSAHSLDCQDEERSMSIKTSPSYIKSLKRQWLRRRGRSRGRSVGGGGGGDDNMSTVSLKSTTSSLGKLLRRSRSRGRSRAPRPEDESTKSTRSTLTSSDRGLSKESRSRSSRSLGSTFRGLRSRTMSVFKKKKKLKEFDGESIASDPEVDESDDIVPRHERRKRRSNSKKNREEKPYSIFDDLVDEFFTCPYFFTLLGESAVEEGKQIRARCRPVCCHQAEDNVVDDEYLKNAEEQLVREMEETTEDKQLEQKTTTTRPACIPSCF